MKKKNHSSLYGFLIAVIGIAMMAFGTFRGEASSVLSNAVMVCLECIGIG